MLSGEYNNADGDDGKVNFYGLILMMMFTFLPNVVFLNLTVAILGDSYEETITSISERCLRD
jgi:hypothetical protein